MGIVIKPAQEGFFRNLKERYDMNKTAWIQDEDVVKILELWNVIPQDVFDHILSARTFKKVPDCGYFFKYFFRSHYPLMTYLVRTAGPVFRQYKKMTKKDVEEFVASRTGRMADLEDEAEKVAKTIPDNEYFLGAKEFRGLKEVEDTFQHRGFDKNRIKQLLMLWRKLENRYDNGDAEKIFPEMLESMAWGDHDDGIVNQLQNHILPTLLGDPSDYNAAHDTFGGFRKLYNTVFEGITAFIALDEDVRWLTKRVVVLMKAKKVIK